MLKDLQEAANSEVLSSDLDQAKKDFISKSIEQVINLSPGHIVSEKEILIHKSELQKVKDESNRKVAEETLKIHDRAEK
jgi:hypothetical protein